MVASSPYTDDNNTEGIGHQITYLINTDVYTGQLLQRQPRLLSHQDQIFIMLIQTNKWLAT